MKKIKLNKKRQLQLHFNYLFNKKSNYLQNLEKLRTEGVKEIENEKVDILIDKCLGINKFERDYSFFNRPKIGTLASSREEPKKRKLKILPNIKLLITSPTEKNEPDRYKPKDYLEDNFSNIYKNSSNNYPEKNNKLYGSYKPISRNRNSFGEEKYLKRNGKNNYSSFLTGIGKNIINNYSEKEDSDYPIKRNKLYNYVTIK